MAARIDGRIQWIATQRDVMPFVQRVQLWTMTAQRNHGTQHKQNQHQIVKWVLIRKSLIMHAICYTVYVGDLLCSFRHTMHRNYKLTKLNQIRLI